MLFLVRHAMPDARPDVPPHAWVLTDEGRAAARRLVTGLPTDCHLVSSDETKAWQTFDGETRSVTRDPRFNEVAREGEPWADDHGAVREWRRAYVRGTAHPGWEPHHEVAARFDAGVGDHVEAADGRPVAIATHGMAMTTWLVERIGLPDADSFWEQLRFPDLHLVDLVGRTAARLGDGVDEEEEL